MGMDSEAGLGLHSGYFRKAEFPWKENVLMLEKFG